MRDPEPTEPRAGNAAPKRRAVLSVSRKEGLAEFGRGLAERGFELVASGGTARFLVEAGVPVVEVSEVTGSPEILGGRVKTLHPAIHGGILARRSRPEDMESLDRLGIRPVEVVAVNFYPFAETVARGADEAEIRENIDIGGPCLVRAAAKNWPEVAVAVDPADYPAVLALLDEADSARAAGERRRLAAEAFRATAAYESAIADRFGEAGPVGDAETAGDAERAGEVGRAPGPPAERNGDSFPERLSLTFDRVSTLRYGENPHQTAALYRDPAGPGAGSPGLGIPGAEPLHGKELSYNNILDLDAALRLAADLAAAHPESAAAVVIKHLNPAGAAVAGTLAEAYRQARATDPVSAFGGIVGLGRPVDLATAEELAATFLEAVVAPGFHDDALARLRRKKNLRLLAVRDFGASAPAGRYLARVAGGLLVQDWDGAAPGEGEGVGQRVATRRAPDPTETEGLRFAWRVARQVRSNAIVVARGGRLLGVGAGQMSRLDSCRLAVEKAREDLAGAVAASDAFFPFPDGLLTLADAGVTAVIQPGGSKRDPEVIAAADERGLSMVFTGRRHFRH